MNRKLEPVSNQIYSGPDYPQSDVTGRIIAAALSVHNNLGPGYREIIYQRALALELPLHDLEFSREVEVDIHYLSQKIGSIRVDFVIEGVMVEIKAKADIEDVDIVQTLSYLKASAYEIGLLLNFGSKKLGIKRLINSVE